MKCHSQQQTDTALYSAQLLKKIKSGCRQSLQRHAIWKRDSLHANCL